MTKHFLELSNLTRQDVLDLIQRAIYFKHSSIFPKHTDTVMANLFYENSTRTRVSFELAAMRLGIKVINLDILHSSEAKGETITDTVRTLAAMGIQLFVIRHKENRLPHKIAAALNENISIINAGDGTNAHPSQALLDLMTIFEQKKDLSKLKITIVGDLLHSRVANSMQEICALMGVGELVLVAPTFWQPKKVSFGRVTTSLKDGLDAADVVIGLRVQHERIQTSEQMDLKQYRAAYAITKSELARSKPNVMLMHPGPINRGVEMDSDVADGVHSYILTQVQNGVFMRMAILERLSLSTRSL